MNAMSEKGSGTGPRRTADDAPRLAHFAYLGAIVGLFGGLGTLFVVSVYYGETLGLAPPACVALGCALTVMLSHAVGLVGLAVGAACGAVAAAVYGLVHHYRRRPARAT